MVDNFQIFSSIPHPHPLPLPSPRCLLFFISFSHSNFHLHAHFNSLHRRYWPDGHKIVKEWPIGIKTLSFRKAVMLIEEERIEEGNRKRAQYASMYSAIRESELQSYVQDCREDIKEERKEKKQAAVDEKRRIQREARDKDKERRLESLLDKDGEPIEGAEEEVKMIRMEVAEAKRIKAGGKPRPPGELMMGSSGDINK